jgi:hypothetical protein
VAETLLSQTARAILDSAYNSPHGIIVEIQPIGPTVAPAMKAKQILYRFKKENADYSAIQIKFSPDDPDRELWLIRNRENGET